MSHCAFLSRERRIYLRGRKLEGKIGVYPVNMADSVAFASSACCNVSGLLASSSLSSSSPKRVSVSKAFRTRVGNARVTCTVEEDVKSFMKHCADAGKMATVALAASALAVSVSWDPFSSFFCLSQYFTLSVPSPDLKAASSVRRSTLLLVHH